jgi:hypothetical protein
MNLSLDFKMRGVLHAECSRFPLGMCVGAIYFRNEEVVRNGDSERINVRRFQCFKVEVRNKRGIMISHQ